MQHPAPLSASGGEGGGAGSHGRWHARVPGLCRCLLYTSATYARAGAAGFSVVCSVLITLRIRCRQPPRRRLSPAVAGCRRLPRLSRTLGNGCRTCGAKIGFCRLVWLAAEKATDDFLEAADVEWLAEVVGKAGSVSVVDVAPQGVGVGGDGDHRDRCGWRVCPQPAQGGETILARQVDVEKDQIRGCLLYTSRCV